MDRWWWNWVIMMRLLLAGHCRVIELVLVDRCWWILIDGSYCWCWGWRLLLWLGLQRLKLRRRWDAQVVVVVVVVLATIINVAPRLCIGPRLGVASLIARCGARLLCMSGQVILAAKSRFARRTLVFLEAKMSVLVPPEILRGEKLFFALWAAEFAILWRPR